MSAEGEVTSGSTEGEVEVVEQVEQETETEAQPQEQHEDEQTREADGKFGPKRGVQTRIDELTAQRYEAQREAAYWRGKAEASGTAPPNPTQSVAPQAEPTRDQFPDDLSYFKGLARWEARQELEQERQAAQQRDAARAYDSRIDSARKALPDFDAVVSNANVPVANHVASAIGESDMSGELLYFLAKNPQEVSRLNEMPPRAAMREVVRLEEKLSSKAAPKTVSNAPNPARPVSSGKGPSDLSGASMDDYIAMRKKQGARWA